MRLDRARFLVRRYVLGVLQHELDSDLRIPTATLRARVRCTDGRELSGRLFVPVSSSSHPGPMRPEERLNDAADFFPFALDDDGGTVFVNKLHVTSIAVAAAEIPEDPEPPVSGPAQRVRLECAAGWVEGTLTLDLPEYKRRVLDYLNAAGRFMPVRDGDTLHLVNRDQVLRTTEISEGAP